MASSLEFNKLLAGVLTAGIIASGSGLIASLLYQTPELEEDAYKVDVADTETAEAEDGEAGPASIAVRLAEADAAAGETITRQCTTCHVLEEGGENRVGPVLWDVVGRDIAAVDGFAYSDALAGMEGDWTFENLDGFLEAPREWAPGTSMSYAGLRDAQDRADLILYLRSLASDPVPLPEPEAATAEAEAPAEEAPAEETAEAPAEEAPAEETAEAPAEEAAAEETAEAPAEEAAAGETAEAPAEEAPAEETAEAPAEEAPAEETAEAPAEEAPAEETAEAPAEEAPAEETAEAPAEEAPAEAGGMVAMVAEADPAAGESQFRQCQACHVAEKGGANRVGPVLWDIFGRDIASVEGFNYSDALQELEGVWTVDKLDPYLENPREFAPGTRMAFAGIRDEADRAAMIAYLHSLSDDPKPLDVE